MKTNVLQNFHICISVPLIEREETGKIMESTCSKSKYRKGRGRKVTIPNDREALFE